VALGDTGAISLAPFKSGRGSADDTGMLAVIFEVFAKLIAMVIELTKGVTRSIFRRGRERQSTE